MTDHTEREGFLVNDCNESVDVSVAGNSVQLSVSYAWCAADVSLTPAEAIEVADALMRAARRAEKTS